MVDGLWISSGRVESRFGCKLRHKRKVRGSEIAGRSRKGFTAAAVKHLDEFKSSVQQVLLAHNGVRPTPARALNLRRERPLWPWTQPGARDAPHPACDPRTSLQSEAARGTLVGRQEFKVQAASRASRVGRISMRAAGRRTARISRVAGVGWMGAFSGCGCLWLSPGGDNKCGVCRVQTKKMLGNKICLRKTSKTRQG